MVWPEAMACFPKVGRVGTVIDAFENHAHDLLYQLIPDARNPEFAQLAIRFGNELLPDWFEAELLGTHLLDDLSNGSPREAIEGCLICPRRHVSRFRFDPFVGDEVQLLLVHEPIQILINPPSVPIRFS